MTLRGSRDVSIFKRTGTRRLFPGIPTPRLLPITIGMLAVVLGTKSVNLVRTTFTDAPAGESVAPFIASALASGHEAPAAHGKPEAKHETGGEHGKPAKPEHGASEPAKADPPPPPIPEGPPPMSESERKVLLDLRARRQELEDRESTLSSRESVLGAAEQKLSSRVDELKGLQQKLESLDAGRRQQEDHAWQGLVKVYETMKPRDAAAIFNDLGMPVLLAVIDRMKEAKAAAIMAAMAPDKARDVTTQLAASRTRAAMALETGRAGTAHDMAHAGTAQDTAHAGMAQDTAHAGMAQSTDGKPPPEPAKIPGSGI